KRGHLRLCCCAPFSPLLADRNRFAPRPCPPRPRGGGDTRPATGGHAAASENFPGIRRWRFAAANQLAELCLQVLNFLFDRNSLPQFVACQLQDVLHTGSLDWPIAHICPVLGGKAIPIYLSLLANPDGGSQPRQ